jgi:hypothetical protein
MPAVNKRFNAGVISARKRLSDITSLQKELGVLETWSSSSGPRDALIAQAKAEARSAGINADNLPREISNAKAEIIAEYAKRKSSIIGAARTKNAIRAALVRDLKGMRPVKAGRNVVRILGAPKKKFMTKPMGK